MPELTEIKVLPYNAKDIFDLVMDIEKYCEFLPWCKDSKIVEKVSSNSLLADLVVDLKLFREQYRSNVKFYQEGDAYVVKTVAISGPFKNLLSRWKITADKDENGRDVSCVEFYISFQFNSFILNKMIGSAFEKVSRKMIESFENRAREVL